MEKLIRPFDVDDAAAMAAVANVAMPYPWSKQLFRDCFAAHYSGWVLTLDEQLRGFCIIKVVEDEAELLNICVDPVSQGMGFGRELLQIALKHVADAAVEVMYLEVRISNNTAIKLYKSLGFKQVGIRKNYYATDEGREDAVIMFCSPKLSGAQS